MGSKMLTQEEISNRFNYIANSYEAALKKYPYARTDHIWLLENANLKSDSNVLEVSGGTGFLTEKISKILTSGELTVHDIAENMLAINKEKLPNKSNINYIVHEDMSFASSPDDYYDVSINLGGFHHIEDQVSFFKGIMNKLKKGGIVCVGDFADNSPVQRYFDEKIDKLTDTGHMGLFASKSRMENLARMCGASEVILEEIPVPFIFESKHAVGEFFQLVHALNQTIDESFKEINEYFEIREIDGNFHVMVDYIYACFRK